MNKNEVRMREELESLLKTNGGVSTKEATELLRVSESTVRRLFDKMQADGEAVRVFGGVRYANTATKYQYDVTLERQRKAKTQIGKLAAEVSICQLETPQQTPEVGKAKVTLQPGDTTAAR